MRSDLEDNGKGNSCANIWRKRNSLQKTLYIFNSDCIVKNIKKENLKVDRYSKNTFYEFSDRYDEKYYYSFEINAKYMKKWRQEECPDIFKVEIDSETLELKKEVVFKKIDRRIKDA